MKHANALAATLIALSVSALFAAGGFNDPVDTTAADTAQQFGTGSSHRRDTPNESRYDCAELDDEQGSSCSSIHRQRYDLFGFASGLTRSTVRYLLDDPADPRNGQPQISGFNASGAWKIERGRPDVAVAVLDTGIRWNNSELRTALFLNAAELPRPRGADGSTLAPTALNLDGYDRNGNGALDVDDYAEDARVNKNGGPNGVADAVDGQDLIRAFSNGDDADGNGFIDDIAGWDFFDDDNDANDASSYFAAGDHGTGRVEEAVEPGNDGRGDIGVCPQCSFMPMRVWDTFVADANNFGMAVVYATDNGAAVIVGADGALYHSAFMEAASEYAWQNNVVQTYSGDDLNTGNHNYPAAYNHAMLIEGTFPDTGGLGQDNAQFNQGREMFCQGPLANMCPGSDVPMGTYFRSANTAQFGGKSSISMWGATGSQNTGRAGGAAALVVSAGRNFSPQLPLSADEVRILLEQTAEDVLMPMGTGTGRPDLANPGWDSHFGWGRVDLGKAVQAVKDGNIPPEASINTPDWYAPLTGASVSFGGVARARRGGDFTWTMEWGTGQAPASWTQFANGNGGSGETVTNLGTLDLAAVRTAITTFVPPVDTGDADFAPNGRHPLKDQFTVRLTVRVAGKMAGIDRKVLTLVPDGQALRPGYPKRLGTGGEAPLRYADLNDDGVQELIVPLEDGSIHAYQPDGSELAGWPAHTGLHYSAARHLTAPVFTSGGVLAPREPLRGVSIADLDQDGRRQVVTAAGLSVYVFNADGSPRSGFPVQGDLANCAPDKQQQENLHPKCGFVATPALAWINGRSAPPVIVAPSLDGRLYAWNGDGTPVSWSPVQLQDQSVAAADRQVAESINNPAIGDLNNDGKDDIVVGTNETYAGTAAAPQPPGAPDDVSFSDVTPAETRVYAIDGATGAFLPGWPIKPGGIIQNVLPFVGPGHDAALVRVNGVQKIVASSTGSGIPGVGSGLSTYNADGTVDMLMKQDARGAASNITDTSGGFNLFEYAVVGDLLGTGLPAIVKYQLGRGQLTNLLVVGQNNPYNHMIGAWNAATGANLEAFPTITDDYQFLSSSTVAKMSATLPTQQILSGTGLGLIHAYDGATGLDIPGFPKVTGGWLFAPAEISDDGRMAAITREGFLFEWDTAHPACQTEWPTFRHDEQGSGNYDRDGTPPYAVQGLAASVSGTASANTVTLNFTASGDDRRCGTAARYEVRRLAEHITAPDWNAATPVDLQDDSPGVAAGLPDSVALADSLPQGRYTLLLRVFDEAGNGSPLRSVTLTIGTPGGRLYFSQASASSTREAGSISFTVTRDIVTSGAASVDYLVSSTSASGQATAGADYGTPVSGTLSFANGASSAAFSVPVLGDSLIEGTERFSVSLTAPVNAVLAAPSAATPIAASGLITDDDSELRFVSAALSASEDAGQVNIEVERLGSGLGVASLRYASSDGSARSNDYSSASGSLSWAAGEVGLKSFAVSVEDDARAEPEETIQLALADAANGGGGETRLGNPATALLTLTDNDIPGIRLSETGSTTVNEGGAPDSYSLVLLSEPATDVLISLSTSVQLSLEQSQFIFTPANWSSPQVVNLRATQDPDAEGTHRAVITHSVASADQFYQGFSLADVTVSISDDDVPNLLFGESQGSTVLSESGQTDSYTLVLSSRPTAEVVVTLDDGVDLAASPISLRFTPTDWDQARTVQLSAVDDAVAEGTHLAAVQHAIRSGDAAYAALETLSFSASITDNDTAGLLLDVPSPIALSEGGSAITYGLRLSSQPRADVVLTVQAGSQLNADPATLVFTPANWNLARRVSLTARDDSLVEGEHSALLGHRLSSSDAGYEGLLVAELAVSLSDNDRAAANTGTPVNNPRGSAWSGLGLLVLLALAGLRCAQGRA